jgi:hypothetical protein
MNQTIKIRDRITSLPESRILGVLAAREKDYPYTYILVDGLEKVSEFVIGP